MDNIKIGLFLSIILLVGPIFNFNKKIKFRFLFYKIKTKMIKKNHMRFLFC